MPKYLSSKELALRLGVTEKTIIRWRSDNIGPPYLKIGGTVRYELSDVEAFEQAARVQTKGA